jgi:hypothetical protein
VPSFDVEMITRAFDVGGLAHPEHLSLENLGGRNNVDFPQIGCGCRTVDETLLALSSTASPEALTPEQEAARWDLQMQSYARWTFWAAIAAFVGVIGVVAGVIGLIR